MSKILQDFWYGNVIPQNGCRLKGPKIKELSDLIVRNRNELIFTMSDEQAEIFDKLDACLVEYVTISEEAIFSYAFKLGMRMATEAFREDLESE